MSSKKTYGQLPGVEVETTAHGVDVCEPFYYDRNYFWNWNFSSRGWGPAKGNEFQESPYHSTDSNMFHLDVARREYKASIRVGPETQKINLWKDEQYWHNADERVTIEVPYAPYLVMMAVLRKPELFL